MLTKVKRTWDDKGAFFVRVFAELTDQRSRVIINIVH